MFVDIVRLIARVLPAFSAFVLAPAVALGCVAATIKYRELLFFFPSDGSAAGLVVPIYLWTLLVLGFTIAGALYFVGVRHLDNGEEDAASGTFSEYGGVDLPALFAQIRQFRPRRSVKYFGAGILLVVLLAFVFG